MSSRVDVRSWRWPRNVCLLDAFLQNPTQLTSEILFLRPQTTLIRLLWYVKTRIVCCGHFVLGMSERGSGSRSCGHRHGTPEAAVTAPSWVLTGHPKVVSRGLVAGAYSPVSVPFVKRGRSNQRRPRPRLAPWIR